MTSVIVNHVPSFPQKRGNARPFVRSSFKSGDGFVSVGSWRFPRFLGNRSSCTRSWNALLAGDMRRRWHVHRLHMHNDTRVSRRLWGGQVNTVSVRILRKLGFEQVSFSMEHSEMLYCSA